jgi:hypothetical protein
LQKERQPCPFDFPQFADAEVAHYAGKDPDRGARAGTLTRDPVNEARAREHVQVSEAVPVRVAVVDALCEPTREVRSVATESRYVLELDSQRDALILPLRRVARNNDSVDPQALAREVSPVDFSMHMEMWIEAAQQRGAQFGLIHWALGRSEQHADAGFWLSPSCAARTILNPSYRTYVVTAQVSSQLTRQPSATHCPA